MKVDRRANTIEKVAKRLDLVRGEKKPLPDRLQQTGCALCGESGPYAVEEQFWLLRQRIWWRVCESCRRRTNLDHARADWVKKLGEWVDAQRLQRDRKRGAKPVQPFSRD